MGSLPINYSLIKPTQTMKATIFSMNIKDYSCLLGLSLEFIFENLPNEDLFLHSQQPSNEEICKDCKRTT